MEMHWELDVPFSGSDPTAIARNLAASLERLADRLEGSLDAHGFVNALEANGVVWRKLGRFASFHDYPVPARAEAFARMLEERARRSVGDDHVAAMIDLNRSTATHIRKSVLKTPDCQTRAA